MSNWNARSGIGCAAIGPEERVDRRMVPTTRHFEHVVSPSAERDSELVQGGASTVYVLVALSEFADRAAAPLDVEPDTCVEKSVSELAEEQRRFIERVQREGGGNGEHVTSPD